MSSHSMVGRARLVGRGALMRLTIVLTAAFCVALPATAAAGTLDQSQPDTDGSSGSVGGTRCWAQTFTAGISGQLDQVDLLLRRGGDPGDLTVEVRTVSGGAPSSTVLASETVAPASVSTGAAAWVSVALSPPAPSSAGTQYAIVLCAPSGDPAENFYGWAAKTLSGDPYPGGQLLSSNDGGATWGPSGPGDFAFKTYVAPAADPIAEIDALIDAVEALDLPSGTENSLLSKLTGAQNNLEADDTVGACDKLASFIAAVHAQSGKKIDADDADTLIDAAEEIRDSIGCG